MSKRKTTLDDRAYIYQKRETKSEIQKLKEMTLKEKWSYFLEYYFVKLLIALAIVAGLLYFLYSILSPKPENVLYIASINNYLTEDITTNLQEEISDYLDLEDMEEVIIDVNYFIDLQTVTDEGIDGDLEESESNIDPNFGFGTSNSATSHMRLSTYMAAQEIDIIIAPESIFEHFMNNEFFDNLEDTLPTDIFTRLQNELYIGTTSANPVSKPYGVRLDNLPNNKFSSTNEAYVFGIVVNSTHKENTISFIRYLLEE